MQRVYAADRGVSPPLADVRLGGLLQTPQASSAVCVGGGRLAVL